MTRWNPSDPAVLGPEFFGATSGQQALAGFGTQLAQRFRSNSAETIANARLHGSRTGVGYPSLYMLEILLAGDETAATTDVASSTYAPNALTTITGTVTNGAGGAAAVTDIDEWPPDYDTTALVVMGTRSTIDLQFATAGFSASGRIASVGIELVTDWGYPPNAAGTDSARRAVVSLWTGTVPVGTVIRTIPNNNSSGTAGRTIVSWGEINPVTGMPWTEADIQSFDTSALQIRVSRYGPDPGSFRLATCRLVIAYETTERREAVGVYEVDGTADAGWTGDIALVQPDGTANWAKASATDYVAVLRVADRGALQGFGSDWFSPTALQAASGQTNPADLTSYELTAAVVTALTDNSVSLATYIATAASETVGTLTPPFVLRTTTPATSADGQPYSDIHTTGVGVGTGDTEQEITSTDTDIYAGLRCLLGWFTNVPNEDLVVDVRRRSDNNLMGTFTITPEEMLAAGGGFATLGLVETKAPDPGISLASGVQYYLDITSASDPGLWLVGALAVVAGSGGVLYEEATFNGGTDRADPVAGSAATGLTWTPADFTMVLDAAVDGPANFAAASSSLSLPDEQPCELTGIPYAQLGWDVTVLGADFAYYQIERLGPDGSTWEQIAQITDEAVDGFSDFEARLGIEESYRIRVVRLDGASSYWSDTVTTTLDVAGIGYTFSSNEYPEQSVGYPDTYNGERIRSYALPEADEVQYRRMLGRDYQVAFKPLSRRGITFSRRLMIGGFAAPSAGVGPAAADQLRDLAWAVTSYICVRDQNGNRWYMSLRVTQVDELDLQDDEFLHWAEVSLVQVTTTPSIVDAAS